MRYFLALLFSLVGSSAFANGGSSVPWPWPWAEECPIDFESLQGTFIVRDSKEVEFIQINTHFDLERKSRYLEIRLYNQNFDLLSSGETYTTGIARTIYIPMRSVKELNVKALFLRIYHRSERRICEPKELIPILTVNNAGGLNSNDSEQMILEPMSWGDKNP